MYCSPLARSPRRKNEQTSECGKDGVQNGNTRKKRLVQNEQATSWSRTRNTMRAWVLASGDATTNEANPAILLFHACVYVSVDTYILFSPLRRFHFTLPTPELLYHLRRERCALQDPRFSFPPDVS